MSALRTHSDTTTRLVTRINPGTGTFPPQRQPAGRPGAAESQPSHPPQIPDGLENSVGRLAGAIVEVHCGARPARQLRRFMTPRALRRLELQLPQERSPNAPIRSVISVRLSAVSPSTVEACAVVQGRRRSHAVALRLKQRRDHWVATDAEIH